VELVQDAIRTIQTQSGDCDDKVVLLASLLASAGFVPRFICGGKTQDVLDHVWLEVYLDWLDVWLPLDPTNEQAAPGWSQWFPYRLEYEVFK
jgi:transglutaminase-like putative cysteine protease